MAFWNNLPLSRVTDFFDLYAREFFSPLLEEKTESRLKVDIYETEKNYSVRAELPGMGEEEIKLSLDDNCLILQTASIYRTIPLHADVDDNSIVATFRDDVLTVNLVKKNDGTERSKKIEINRSFH